MVKLIKGIIITGIIIAVVYVGVIVAAGFYVGSKAIDVNNKAKLENKSVLESVGEVTGKAIGDIQKGFNTGIDSTKSN